MSEFLKWERGIKESFITEMKKHNARFEGWKAALEWAHNKLQTDANGFFKIGKEIESFSQQSNDQF